MTNAKIARNLEIVHMHAQGITYKEIGRHFGISAAAARLVVCRSKDLDASLKMPKTPLTATYRPGARPRLRKASSGLWECSDGVVERAGRTFQGAYQRWLTAAIAEAQDQLQAEA